MTKEGGSNSDLQSYFISLMIALNSILALWLKLFGNGYRSVQRSIVCKTRKETEILYSMNRKWCIAGIASFADNNILSLGLTTVLDTSQFTVK